MVKDRAVSLRACGMSPGRETICWRMPTHGTPPRVGVAFAAEPRNGALRNKPALPIMTTTMPFFVRDMCSQSFYVRAARITSV